MIAKLTCIACGKEKFEVEMETVGDASICKDCMKKELVEMVVERVRKRKKINHNLLANLIPSFKEVRKTK